uniref:Uncharacterized protein n=1 Tax=Ciona intestinalis TaxID=7719 RepID=L7N0Q3_CIOIN
MAAPLTGVTSLGFVGLSIPLNFWLMLKSIKFYRQTNSNSAHHLYKCSLYYILLISLALIVDRKVLTKLSLEKYDNILYA